MGIIAGIIEDNCHQIPSYRVSKDEHRKVLNLGELRSSEANQFVIPTGCLIV